MITLLLKKDTKEKLSYYLTSISEEQKEELFLAKKTETLKNLAIVWDIDCEGVMKLGETSKITTDALSAYVDSFRGNANGSPCTHYRDYTKTKAAHLDIAWCINICESPSSSVRTALKQMRGKYSVLWSTDIDSTFDKTFDKLLKDVAVCKTLD